MADRRPSNPTVAIMISPRRIPSSSSATSSNPMAIIIHCLSQISYPSVTNSFERGLAFIIPTLLAFLALMFLGTGENPFSTHHKTMRAAVATSVIYYLISSQQLSIRLLHFSPEVVNRHCLVWFGNATVASLVSILIVPDSVRPLPYVVVLVLSARELLRWLCKKVVEGAAEFFYGTRFVNALRSLSRMAAYSWFPRPGPIIPL